MEAILNFVKAILSFVEAILSFVEAILCFVEAILIFVEAILNLVKTKSTPRFDLDLEFDNKVFDENLSAVIKKKPRCKSHEINSV